MTARAQPASVDFHCHLDLYDDSARAFDVAAESNAYVLSVTTTPSAWRGTRHRTRGRRVRTALGLHPQIAHERHAEIGLFEDLIKEARYIGEVGLDGSKAFGGHLKIQREVFDRILRLCAAHSGRVITVHSRGAADDTLDVIARHPDAGSFVLHWFTGTRTQLRRAVDLGCWFSVGPAMLGSNKGVALAASIPRQRILTETDGPFGMVDGRALAPGEVGRALAVMSSIWGVPIESVHEIVAGNLRSLVAEQRTG